jgi:hypothetical protein
MNLGACRSTDPCDVFDVARGIALDWVREKGYRLDVEGADQDFVREDGAIHLHQTEGDPARGLSRILALRLVQPDVAGDVSDDGHRVRIPGREWITDILLQDENLNPPDPPRPRDLRRNCWVISPIARPSQGAVIYGVNSQNCP